MSGLEILQAVVKMVFGGVLPSWAELAVTAKRTGFTVRGALPAIAGIAFYLQANITASEKRHSEAALAGLKAALEGYVEAEAKKVTVSLTVAESASFEAWKAAEAVKAKADYGASHPASEKRERAGK